MSLAILFHFLCAQHVLDINIFIIRSLRLFCWITTLVVLSCIASDIKLVFYSSSITMMHGPINTTGGWYSELDWSLYTCLTQLYGRIDMYNLLHKEQLHVSALFIGHLQVDKWETLVSSYTRLLWVAYRGRSGVEWVWDRMCSVGRVVWVHGFCYILF